jgi:hypothetical protein
VLSELRDRLRAGDVWVTGSRQYRSVEERLISKQTFQGLQSAGTIPVAVEADFDKFIESRRALLDKRLRQVNSRTKDGLLSAVTIEKGALKITPIEKSTPPEAEALAAFRHFSQSHRRISGRVGRHGLCRRSQRHCHRSAAWTDRAAIRAALDGGAIIRAG